MESLEALKSAAMAAIGEAGTPGELEQLRVDYLGKKGSITGLLKTLGSLSADERPKAGALINAVKQEVTEVINHRRASLETGALEAKLNAERIDVTLPGRNLDPGGLHPITRTIQRVEDFFLGWASRLLRVRKSKMTTIILKP